VDSKPNKNTLEVGLAYLLFETLSLPDIAKDTLNYLFSFNSSGSTKQEECMFHISFTGRKLWLIAYTPLFFLCLGYS